MPFIKEQYDNIGDSDCILADFRKGIADWFMLTTVTKTGLFPPNPALARLDRSKNEKLVDFIFLANDAGIEGSIILRPHPDGTITYKLNVVPPVPLGSPGYENYLYIFGQVSDHPMHRQ